MYVNNFIYLKPFAFFISQHIFVIPNHNKKTIIAAALFIKSQLTVKFFAIKKTLIRLIKLMMTGWDENMNLSAVLNQSWIWALSGYMAFVFIRLHWVIFLLYKHYGYESVQDVNVCSIFCLGTAVPRPEICGVVWHIIRNALWKKTGCDKLKMHTQNWFVGGLKLQKI